MTLSTSYWPADRLDHRDEEPEAGRGFLQHRPGPGAQPPQPAAHRAGRDADLRAEPGGASAVQHRQGRRPGDHADGVRAPGRCPRRQQDVRRPARAAQAAAGPKPLPLPASHPDLPLPPVPPRPQPPDPARRARQHAGRQGRGRGLRIGAQQHQGDPSRSRSGSSRGGTRGPGRFVLHPARPDPGPQPGSPLTRQNDTMSTRRKGPQEPRQHRDPARSRCRRA